MVKKGNFTQCKLCKYFVEDDESLKHTIEYCILLGININTSGNCPEYKALSEEFTSFERDSDPEPEPVS